MITENIRRAKFKEDHLDDYFDNLYVLGSCSFLNLKRQLIIVQTPIPNKSYEIKGIYNISERENEILIHISDGTSNETQGNTPKNKNYILGITFNFSDIKEAIGSKKLSVNNNMDIKIVVFNENNNNIDTNNIITVYREKDPDENGGGIIIEGP